MDIRSVKSVYFLGIGGIGMSALARYFAIKGACVSGYDKTSTELTDTLQAEGIAIHFEEDLSKIPQDTELIVYTPAIPKDNAERVYLEQSGITMLKRSELLGLLTAQNKTIAISGTHGKTTTSTMVAHILNSAHTGCTAFLGGISKNYDSNLILSPEDTWIVTEADEFDRSFHQLFPTLAVITAIDADHLDIYGTYKELVIAFNQFASQVKQGGAVLIKKGLEHLITNNISAKILTYGVNQPEADFNARNIRVENGVYNYEICTPTGILDNIELGVPALMNIENSVAAAAMAQYSGCDAIEIRNGLKTFKGIHRRFEMKFKHAGLVYIDDYAHHPEEIKALVNSVRQLYPGVAVTGIFQPHLFSRTQDFAEGFAKSLDLLDYTYLLDIYPARELPIPGVDSQLIAGKMLKPCAIVSREEVLKIASDLQEGILLTIGAGDIDKLVAPIEDILHKKAGI